MTLDFLTRSELIALTGRQTAPAQTRYLERSRIPHSVDDCGHVKVLRAHALRLHGVQDASAARDTAPDFSVFEQHGTTSQ